MGQLTRSRSTGHFPPAWPGPEWSPASPPGHEVASPAGRDHAPEIQAAPERRRGDGLCEERAGECRRCGAAGPSGAAGRYGPERCPG
ncbi:cuticle collagen 2-like [Pezoporus occidentalis]|uniref:cuticle collagen 2-like n=1 Tax=Pezoporus occidentalis TaxID=407982 RepID=UPI002F91B117